jgi:hypothetical protein
VVQFTARYKLLRSAVIRRNLLLEKILLGKRAWVVIFESLLGVGGLWVGLGGLERGLCVHVRSHFLSGICSIKTRIGKSKASMKSKASKKLL